MDTSNMKNIVVLKDLPSNIVDEAIVILKSNVNLKKYDFVESKKESIKSNVNSKKETKNYIVKEAEAIVSNYLSRVEKPKELECKNKKLEKKYSNIKKLTIFFAVLAIFGIVVNLI